jgi:hypothetical protein
MSSAAAGAAHLRSSAANSGGKAGCTAPLPAPPDQPRALLFAHLHCLNGELRYRSQDVRQVAGSALVDPHLWM